MLTNKKLYSCIYVLITTIAHELVHYAHGFGSPLPRQHKYPHANGVVERELASRALSEYLYCCNQWIDKYWYSFYDMQRASGWEEERRASHTPPPQSRRASIAARDALTEEGHTSKRPPEPGQPQGLRPYRPGATGQPQGLRSYR
jgi:hypothetical protein